MEPKTNGMVVVSTFEIPDELAKRLSDLLVQQSIREKVLANYIDDPAKYEQAESLLIPIVAEVESIKNMITREYVPVGYRSDEYMWNYDGYEIDGNRVQILSSNS